jgi:hypothetical protein
LFAKTDEFFAAVLMRHPFFWDMKLDILILEDDETTLFRNVGD